MFQTNPSCHKCDGVKESVLHVLRDCPWTSRWRNKEIFTLPFCRPQNADHLIQKYVKNIEETFERTKPLKNQRTREEIHIGWLKPPEGWSKLNSESQTEL
ncbi:hypothetical protein AHAS_Ahas17G0101700 [Arachis hypogaea]